MERPRAISSQNKESQYIKTIEITLQKIRESGECTPKNRLYLQNMVQGFLLNYFYIRLSEYLFYRENILTDNRFLIVLSNVLYQDIFPLVRSRFNQDNDLILEICRIIIETKIDNSCLLFICNKNMYIKLFNVLCPGIELKKLHNTILNDVRVKKALLQLKFEKISQDKEICNKFKNIVEHEDSDIILTLFSRYINNSQYKRLISLLTTGQWQIEADFLRHTVYHR